MQRIVQKHKHLQALSCERLLQSEPRSPIRPSWLAFHGICLLFAVAQLFNGYRWVNRLHSAKKHTRWALSAFSTLAYYAMGNLAGARWNRNWWNTVKKWYWKYYLQWLLCGTKFNRFIQLTLTIANKRTKTIVSVSKIISSLFQEFAYGSSLNTHHASSVSFTQ